MKSLASLLAVVVAICVLLSAPVAAQDALAAETVTKIVKFVSSREGAAAGKPALTVRTTSKYNATQFELIVPNVDPAAAKANPDPAMERVIKAAKAGDLLKVTYAKVQTRLVLSQVEAWTARPGELDAEAYELVKTTEIKVGEQARQAVVLSKADKEQTVFLPTKKNADGAEVSDEAVAAQVAKLKPGDLADGQVIKVGADSVLKWIFPYQTPVSASFVKLATQKGDSGATENVVTLKKSDTELALPVIPGTADGSSDPAVLARAKSLKAGGLVLYKSVEDGTKKWLIDIKADNPVMPAGDVNMTGTFVWNGERNGAKHDLKVVLTPTAPGQYKAVYTFTWNGTPKTYTGTITGNLRSGEITGTGDGDRRNFTFTGTAQNGVIDFKAFELIRGRPAPQGSGTMKVGA
jgi:hypothetical protein